jgi:hypothetical protein
MGLLLSRFIHNQGGRLLEQVEKEVEKDLPQALQRGGVGSKCPDDP